MPGASGWLDANLQNCMKNNCIKLKPTFTNWDVPGNESCFGKCNKTFTACNSNDLENWWKNKGGGGTLQQKFNDLLIQMQL